jgi:hypothetical protein
MFVAANVVVEFTDWFGVADWLDKADNGTYCFNSTVTLVLTNFVTVFAS